MELENKRKHYLVFIPFLAMTMYLAFSKKGSKHFGSRVNRSRALVGYNLVSPRIIMALFQGQPIVLSVVQIYAPTADSSYNEIETLYDEPRKNDDTNTEK